MPDYRNGVHAKRGKVMRSKSSLIDFTRYTLRSYQLPAHHDMIEAVARGEIKRLRIHMPPRHGKSEFASKRFPKWQEPEVK